MSMHRASIQFTIALTLALVLLGPTLGCSRRTPAWSEGLQDLAGIPVSPALRTALDEAVATLGNPAPRTATAAGYDTFRDLRIRLRRPDTREAALDELYALWEAEPDNTLWLYLAHNPRRDVDRPGEFRRLVNRPALADTNTALGSFVAGLTTPRRADRGRWYRKAESLADQLPPLSRLRLVLSLAAVDQSHGRFIPAVERLLAALPLARRTAGVTHESQLWFQASEALMRADHLDDALYAAAISGALARAGADDYQLLQARIRLATIRGHRGEAARAIDQLEEFGAQAWQQGFPWLAKSSLNSAAIFASDDGDYDRALRLDREILRQARETDDLLNIPRALASIAHDHRMTGRLDSTYVYLMQARDEAEASDLPENRAKMPELLASYFCQVGQYARAESLLEAASAANDARNHRAARAALLLELVPSALETGRPDLAYGWLAEVAAVQESLPPRDRDRNLQADFEILSARLFGQQGETRRAAAALERAWAALDTRGGEGVRWNLYAQTGELALQRGDPASAEQAFVACLDLALQGQDPQELARSRFQLGEVYLAMARFADARALFTPLVQETTFGHAYRTGLTSLLLLAMTSEQEGDLGQALSLIEAGLARLNPDSPADLALRFHLAQGRVLSRLGRHQQAEEVLAGVLSGQVRSAQRFADLQVFQTNLARDTREALIANTLRSGGSGAAALAWAYPALARDPAGGPADGPVLLYFVGREGSWVWRVGGGRVTVRELPGAAALGDLVLPLLVDLGEPDRPGDAGRTAALARMLLGDIAADWPAGATLHLVSDGILRLVPWPALPLPDGGGLVLDRGPVSEWSGDAKRPVPAAGDPVDRLSLLAIGCDDPGDSRPGLRQAEAEAAQIRAAWTGPQATLLRGEAASWDNALRGGLATAGVIHIASHAEVHEGAPGRSTLRLASGIAGGEPVTMSAVGRLGLDARLVFLSSCRSGRPSARPTAGPDDFLDAFLTAGAGAVVASTLWVDDEAARHLATRFYDHWRDGAEPPAALRAAQQDVRHRWPQPAYWAFYRLVEAGG